MNKIVINNLEFTSIKLIFDVINKQNVFVGKNNKTVQETLRHKRYLKRKSIVDKSYSKYLNVPLGEFLITLKSANDTFYKSFLNKYGDLKYCNFKIDDCLHLKGLYCFAVNDKVKYIGRCRDSYKKRINNGYGNISPKNCYLDGQATNCHMNNLILNNKENIQFYVHPMTIGESIVELEKQLIDSITPEWNLVL